VILVDTSVWIDHGDAHLLAAVMVTPGTTLWTRDERLHMAAERLGVAHT
jgi:predicted nucleic acid-binding protein